MNNLVFEKEVARLDGFLSGVAALNGDPKDYSAYAYSLKLKSKDFSVRECLKNYYEWAPDVEFTDPIILDGGMRFIEREIGNLLVRDSFSSKSVTVKKYLLSRAMDILSEAIGNNNENVISVFVTSNNPKAGESKCFYYCFHLSEYLLILQFNDNRNFRRRS